MNRSAHWLFGLALLPLAACASNPPPAPAPVAPPLAAADQTFLNTTSGALTGDLQVNQLAAGKARSTAVKQEASGSVDAETQSLQQLQTLAQSKNVTLDTAAPQPTQDLLAKLNADKPATFDRDYLRGEIAIDEAGVTTYQNEAANGQDADVKAFAASSLPPLQANLERLRHLSGAGAVSHAAAKRHHSAK